MEANSTNPEIIKKIVSADNNTQLNYLVDNTPLAVIISDQHGTIVKTNPLVTEVFGYQPEDLLGKHINILLPQSMRETHENKCETFFSNPQPRMMHQGLEIIGQHKAGFEIPIEIALTSIEENGQELAVSFIIDISKRKMLENALKDSERFSRTIFASVEQGIVGFDHDLYYTFWNSYMEKLTGKSANDVLYHPAADIMPHLIEHGFDTAIKKALEGEIVRTGDTPFIMPNSDRAGWLVGHFSPHTTLEGKIIGAIGIIFDVTERRRIEDELLAAKQRNEIMLQTSIDGFAVLDIDGNLREVNRSLCELIGYEREELLSMNLSELILSEDSNLAEESTKRVMKLGSDHYEARYHHSNGQVVFLEAGSNYYEYGGENFFFTFFRDITDRKKAEEYFKHVATHDTLTNLPNRAYFNEQLNTSLNHIQATNEQLAVMFIDLDGFKQVNDTLGHEKGDVLLRQVAQRLLDNVGKNNFVARLGGDEFTILLNNVENHQSIEIIAKTIIDAIRQPYNLEGESARVTASVGISIAPDDGKDSLTIIRNADSAMYISKQSGKNRYIFYQTGMEDEVE